MMGEKSVQATPPFHITNPSRSEDGDLLFAGRVNNKLASLQVPRAFCGAQQPAMLSVTADEVDHS